MKRKVSNPSETFTVTNRNEKDVYGVSVNSVENSQLITIHKSEDQQVAVVMNKQSDESLKYSVEVGNDEVFIIEKIVAQGAANYVVTGEELTIDGELLDMSFNIMLGYRKVAKVRKRWTSLGDSYELTIFEDENEVAVVGLVSILDFLKCDVASKVLKSNAI